MSKPGFVLACVQKLRRKSSAVVRKSVAPAICATMNTLRHRDRRGPSAVSIRIDATRLTRVACSAGRSAGTMPANATSKTVKPMSR